MVQIHICECSEKSVKIFPFFDLLFPKKAHRLPDSDVALILADFYCIWSQNDLKKEICCSTC